MTYNRIDACLRMSNSSLSRLASLSTGRARPNSTLVKVSHQSSIPSRPFRPIGIRGSRTTRSFTSSRSTESDTSETFRRTAKGIELQPWRRDRENARSQITLTSKTSVINENGKPFLEVQKTRKQVTHIMIRPSYPEKPVAVQNLLKGLEELLVRDKDPLISEFGSDFWYLDESGLAVHRYFVVKPEVETKDVLDQIQVVAQEMDHHPHIVTEGKMVTVTCSTHVPPGLSMRDIRLARKIDELMEGKIQLSDTPKILGNYEVRDIIYKRRTAQGKNMTEIHKAHERGTCGTNSSSQTSQSDDSTPVTIRRMGVSQRTGGQRTP